MFSVKAKMVIWRKTPATRVLKVDIPPTRAWTSTNGHPAPPRPAYSRPRTIPYLSDKENDRRPSLIDWGSFIRGTMILVGWATAALVIRRMGQGGVHRRERGIRSAAPPAPFLEHETPSTSHLPLAHESCAPDAHREWAWPVPPVTSPPSLALADPGQPHIPPPPPPTPPPAPPTDPLVVMAEPHAPARRLWCLYDITIEISSPEVSPEPLAWSKTQFPYCCIPRLQALAEGVAWEAIDNDLWALQKRYRTIEHQLQFVVRATRESRVCELRRRPNGRFGWFPVTEEVEFSSSLEEIMENMSRRARPDLWLEEEHWSGPDSPRPSPPPSPMLPPVDDAYPLMRRRISVAEPGREDGDTVGVDPRWRERVMLG
ncbi:hypothetical protein RhiJN_01717 [Ceratobasidium sp. AG-Ba]|nr:hypothetical protein RhiJN_01717 [Ceratobasidium sp. AG-Ba]QRW02644.1 hypothetical protein RhiLY_01643 [Ceratobasidium sp. AG-Ba]